MKNKFYQNKISLAACCIAIIGLTAACSTAAEPAVQNQTAAEDTVPDTSDKGNTTQDPTTPESNPVEADNTANEDPYSGFDYDYNQVFSNVLSIDTYAEHLRWHYMTLIDYDGVENFKTNYDIVMDYENPDNTAKIYEIYKNSGFTCESEEEAIELAQEFSAIVPECNEFVQSCAEQIEDIKQKYPDKDYSALDAYYRSLTNFWDFMSNTDNVNDSFEQRWADLSSANYALLEAAKSVMKE